VPHPMLTDRGFADSGVPATAAVVTRFSVTDSPARCGSSGLRDSPLRSCGAMNIAAAGVVCVEPLIAEGLWFR